MVNSMHESPNEGSVEFRALGLRGVKVVTAAAIAKMTTITAREMIDDFQLSVRPSASPPSRQRTIPESVALRNRFLSIF